LPSRPSRGSSTGACAPVTSRARRTVSLPTREGYCYQHVQAIAVAIDQYAEKAAGQPRLLSQQALRRRLIHLAGITIRAPVLTGDPRCCQFFSVKRFALGMGALGRTQRNGPGGTTGAISLAPAAC
jgi:hypothetical protein